MNTEKSNGKKAVKIIISLVLVIVLVGVVGIIYHKKDAINEELKPFYVVINGEEILSTGSGYEATVEQPLKVEVKYKYSNLADKPIPYSVKIIPNAIAGKDFDFVKDGEICSFQAETDLTEGFNFEYKEDSFSFTPKGATDVVLKGVYTKSEITDCANKGYPDMYSLIVTSYDGLFNVTIHFSAYESLCEVFLDKEEIAF